MPIESPLLDDLRYDRVVEELLRRIPVHTPEWTDHNDSDPGITLIQLFAYLTEQIGWRLNRVPEKTHVELLKLLGIRLEAARAARTQVAFLLAHPAINPGVILDAGSRVARKGTPPILFETDAVHDVVPAEPRCIVTTKHPFLWDLLRIDEVGNREPAPTDPELPAELPAEVTRWMSVAWDGAKPKPVDMPLAPIVLAPPATTGDVLPYLWLGLEHNDLRDGGFLGAAVTLAIQLDDDEQPDPRATVACEPAAPKAEPAPPPIDWLAYYDEDRGQMLPIPGRIIDATDKLAHSGTIRFTVPLTMGPIEDWANLREKFPPDGPLPDVCKVMTAELIAGLPQGPMWDPATFSTALTNAVDAVTAESAEVKPAVGHPLDPALRDPAKITSWLRLGPLSPEVLAGKKLRHVGFNVVGMTQAETVRNLILGRSDGRPGQVFRLGHRNVFADSLELAIAESSDPKALLTTWKRTDSLAAAGPFDRVFDLDPEAGAITFGDGQRGRIPPLVPKGGTVVALRYRHGGGVAGESAVGTITGSLVQITGLLGVVNVVAAAGGEDAETLDGAKLRARKELSTRSRAVTADDFEWIALRTPDVRVARAIVVPRRRPLPGTPPTGKSLATEDPAREPAPGPWCSPAAMLGAPPSSKSIPPPPLAAPTCGPPLPAAPAGLEDDFEAAGVVTVVVVPDQPGFEPLPVPSFLRAVCRQLDRHRLVTTEVHVAPPQYCRLCDFVIVVRARAGWSRLAIQESIARLLGTWLDVLRGGDAGTGAPFGGQVHVADLIARVLRLDGVDRVEDLRCRFVRTKSNASPRTGRLVLCPTAADEHDRVQLAAEETTSVDLSSLTVSTVV